MNAGGASRGGRYRPNRKRRVSTAMLGLLAAVVAVGVMLALSTRAVVAHPSPCPEPVTAQVAVSGEFAPVAERVGAFFNRQHRMMGGHCEQVAVRVTAPAAVAAQFAAGTAARRQPAIDAWVPDSQTWIDIARSTPAGASAVQPAGPVLARTALVIAMPRPTAAKLPAYGSLVGWNFLLPESTGGPSAALHLNVQVPDPTQSAVGLDSVMEFRKIFGYGRAAHVAIATFAYNAQVVPTGQNASTLASLGQPAADSGTANPVTVTSEQTVVQFDRSHPSEPLAVRYPAGGTDELTYPYLLTTTSRAALRVAKAFGVVLQSPYASAYARYEGFRTGSGPSTGWPATYDLDQREPTLLRVPGPVKTIHALHAWERLTLGSRLLALNDVSSSMATPAIPGGPTLEQVLAHAAAIGLTRFPDSTQMGLWAFANHLQGSQPYKQIVPLGPLPGPFGLVTRRQAIAHMAASAVTVPTGAALYQSILDGYQELTANFQPRYVNAEIVMTAGVDSPKVDIPSATLLRDLKTLYNPKRPINVIVIMLGRAGDFGALQQIAAATNGKAYDITSPPQIAQVFYQAMGRRICLPHCRP